MASLGRWGLVSWDATRTLLRLRRPVGVVYAELAGKAGITVDPTALDHGFAAAYAATDNEWPNFGFDALPSSLAWWTLVVRRTFQHAGVPFEALMPVLEPLAAQAFEEFRTDRCWELATPRVRDVLRHARERADCMVVISNFDERLPDVLASLQIRDCFDVVLTSVAAGVPKPAGAIFLQAAAAAPPAQPARYLHIGDHWTKDVQGALRTGPAWHAVWVRGSQPATAPDPRVTVVQTVDNLLTNWPTP